jgi:hypothetical protein
MCEIHNCDICVKKDFGHKRNEMRQNFVKTDSLGLRKTFLNTTNFR